MLTFIPWVSLVLPKIESSGLDGGGTGYCRDFFQHLCLAILIMIDCSFKSDSRCFYHDSKLSCMVFFVHSGQNVIIII